MAKATGKAFVPTDKERATVKAMAGYGIKQDDIARVIGVHGETLRKAFRHELDIAATEANAQVAQSLFKMATSGQNVAAAIFWLKTRAGWKDPIFHELGAAGKNGATLLVTGVVRASDQEGKAD